MTVQSWLSTTTTSGAFHPIMPTPKLLKKDSQLCPRHGQRDHQNWSPMAQKPEPKFLREIHTQLTQTEEGVLILAPSKAISHVLASL
jgi:hypothetical protein